METFDFVECYPVDTEHQWKTLRYESRSGVVQKHKLWSKRKSIFRIEHKHLSDTQVGQLFSFFDRHYGSYGEFYYWEQIYFEKLGAGDGGAVLFSTLRNPVDSVKIYLDEVIQSVDDYTLDADNGRITFNTAPTMAKIVEGTYKGRLIAEFLDDKMSYSEFTVRLFSGNLTIVEVKQ